jgi:hypothetical protein
MSQDQRNESKQADEQDPYSGISNPGDREIVDAIRKDDAKGGKGGLDNYNQPPEDGVYE